LLELWKKSDKKPDSKIFGIWDRSEYNPEVKVFYPVKDIKRAYDTACRPAGVQDLHFRDWRHGFAADLTEAGVPERVAMKAAGHTSSEAHSIYTNADERLAKMVAESLDRLRGKRGGEAGKEDKDEKIT
jgi:integrase